MELAFTGAFAWAAWQVLGKLQRHAAKIEKSFDDALLLGEFEAELKAQEKKKQRASAAMGLSATQSGHEHIFEEWKKLKPAQMVQLATDIADLAQWATGPSCFIPELRADGPLKPWNEYNTAGKVHLLEAADRLYFNFGEVVKREAEKLGLADNWLWQVNEALPALSAEPGQAAAPTQMLADLKTRLTEAEAVVRSAFDAERRSQAAGLKGLVEPLAVAACMRKLQVLKVLLEEVGLTPSAATACRNLIRSGLKAPLTLAAASPEVAEQKAAAAAAVQGEADAAVEAVRKSKLVEIEAAAARVYRRALTLQASSPSHWHASSDTPALHRLGLVSALLAELACQDAAGSSEGSAAAAELADAVRKLVPQIRLKLTEEQAARQAALLEALTPAPPPPPAPPARLESLPTELPTPTDAKPEVAEAAPERQEAEEGEAAEEGEETKEKEAAKEGETAEPKEEEVKEEESPPPPAPRLAPGEAARELSEFLEAVIRGQLAEAAAARKAARVAAKEAAAKEAAEARQEADAAAQVAAEASAAAAAAASAATDAKAAAVAAAEAKAAATTTEEAAPAAAEEGEGVEAAAAEPKAEAEAEPAATEEAEAEARAAEAEAKAKEAAAAEAKAAAAEGRAKEAEARAAEAAAAAEAEEPPSETEAVDVGAVRKGVEAEARDRSEMEKEEAILQMQDSLDAMRIRVTAKAHEQLIARVAAAAAAAASKTSDGGADADADGTPAATEAAAPLDAGSRLLALEVLLRGAAAATDIALPGAVADAAAKVTADDRAALDAASAAALARLEAAAARVRLTADVLKLDMGPGCCEVLRRAEAWLEGQEKEVGAQKERAAARAARAAARAERAAARAAAAEAKAAKEASEAAAKEEEAAAKAAAEAEAAEGGEAKVEEEEEAKEVTDEEVTEEVTEDIVEAPESDEKEEEEEEAAGPLAPGNPERLAEGRKLIRELLQEGLVLLELPAPSNRKLQNLRESVDALNPVDGDGAVQNRVITTLKEVVGQLGPIGGSVDARVREVVDEASRERLLQVRSAALSIFTALSAFLRLETETWEGAKNGLDQAKKAVFGMKVERRAESLAAAIEACGGVAERCAALATAVMGLKSTAAAEGAEKGKKALQETAEQSQYLSGSLQEYISYVRLREHALGVAVTAKAEAEDDFELTLPSLDEMQKKHCEGAVWLDLAGMGLPPPPSPEDEEEEGEAGASGQGEDEEAEASGATAAHEAALAALQERLDGWHVTGLKMLARGQAALVTLGGAALERGELRLTADIGLPSGKSLLQLGAEKIARLQVLAAESVSGPNSGVAYPLHWYLLVAPASVEPLRTFLHDNQYFGLQAAQIHVFANDVRPPLLTEELKVVLDASGTRTARSQPGSGEVFLALRRSGALAHLRRSGVRGIEVASLEDNLMARPLDPAFLGACAATAIDCAAKVAVPGVQTDGACALPELYSRYLDLLGASSHLLPTLGDAVPAIGTYYFSMDFVRRVDKMLRAKPLALYRLAPADKVPTRGSAAGAAAAAKAASAAGGAAAAAGGAAGYRLERRLSDFASPAICELIPGVHVAMVAVDAGAEFAPVWGTAPFYRTASPKAAVDALLLQHTRWVEESGGAVAEEDDVVEVGPLVSYAGEGLGPLVEGKTFAEAYVHELQGFATESLGTGSNLGWWVAPSVVLYGGVAAAKLLGKAAGK